MPVIQKANQGNAYQASHPMAATAEESKPAEPEGKPIEAEGTPVDAASPAEAEVDLGPRGPESEASAVPPAKKAKRAKKAQAPRYVVLHNGVGQWGRGDEFGEDELDEAALERLIDLGAVCPKGEEFDEDEE